MVSGWVELATSAMVPAGPVYARSAEPSERAMSGGRAALALALVGAASAGVVALGMNAFEAASAGEENGQKAAADCGKEKRRAMMGIRGIGM